MRVPVCSFYCLVILLGMQRPFLDCSQTFTGLEMNCKHQRCIWRTSSREGHACRQHACTRERGRGWRQGMGGRAGSDQNELLFSTYALGASCWRHSISAARPLGRSSQTTHRICIATQSARHAAGYLLTSSDSNCYCLLFCQPWKSKGLQRLSMIQGKASPALEARFLF